MSSSSETIISIRKLSEDLRSTGQQSATEEGGPVNSTVQTVKEQTKERFSFSSSSDGDAKEFRDKLVRFTSSRFRALELFMSKSDEYPRFVWQDFLLSFQSCLIKTEENIGKVPVVAKFGEKKFSHIIDVYPDILQRELLRDSFQLANHSGDRYGALHAAVLCGRVDLVNLVKDPDTDTRETICGLLTPPEKVPTTAPGEVPAPTEADEGFDSFSFIRRAVLWSRMHMLSAPYAKVATFMKEFNKVRKPSEIVSLGLLIDKSTGQIDLKDKSIPDPWVVVLAWASTSANRGHIIDEFKTRKSDLFKQIQEALTKSGSSFAYFLTDDPVEPATDPANLQDRGQQPRSRTVESIVKLLVLVPPNLGESHGNLMQRFFLDRLSDRTPNFRWSPLHLAAAYGDHTMVSTLISSCDKILGNLGEGLKKIYIKNIQESFFDAKYMTPLHHAVLGNHKKVVESLLGWSIFQPYVDESDIFMRTAFQMACSNRERAAIVLQLMEDQGVDLNTKDCCLFTCLHWAVFSVSTEVVKVLISEGKKGKIRTTEKDSEGLHPYELASRCKALSGHSKTSENADIQMLLLRSPAVKAEVDTLYRDRQVYVDASNAILVGAALIASVTFGGWLQPPLGTDEGSPSYGVVTLFWAFSSLSFFFSIATVMSGAAAVLPIGDEYIKDSVESIRRWLVVSSFLLILSVAFVLGAFAAAGFAALSPLPQLRTNMAITTSIGSVVCGTIGLLFCSRLWRVRPDWLRDWLNLVSKVVLQCCNKEELMRKVKSLKQIPDSLSRQRAEQAPVSHVAENGNPAIYGPQNSPTLTSILESIPIIMELLKSKSTMQRSKSLPTSVLIDSGPPPTGVTRERLAHLWKEKHPQDVGLKSKASCLIRDCYRQLESHCHSEIANFNIDTVDSLKEYVEMWSCLSQDPLQGVTLPEKVLQKVKEFLSTRGAN